MYETACRDTVLCTLETEVYFQINNLTCDNGIRCVAHHRALVNRHQTTPIQCIQYIYLLYPIECFIFPFWSEHFIFEQASNIVSKEIWQCHTACFDLNTKKRKEKSIENRKLTNFIIVLLHRLIKYFHIAVRTFQYFNFT